MEAHVKAVMEAQLARLATRSPRIHLDLDRCLVNPSLQNFRDFPADDPARALWVVLEEDPVDHAGYKIAYDPSADAFCLCIGKQPGATYVGHYGTFEDALLAM